MDNGFMIPPPSKTEDEYGSAFGGSPRASYPAGEGYGSGKGMSSAEQELRQVAETLSRTGKALSGGLAQANEQGQRLRGAISRLERANEWSTAERKRAEDEITGFFNTLREVLRAKEDELLRDIRGVYAVQDEDNKRRLEELVIQGQKLSKACMAVQALHEGSSNATLGSLNSPLNNLLEALETSGRILDREEEHAQHESARFSQRGRPSSADVTAGTGSEERGIKFHFCNDQSVQRAVESLETVHYESSVPPLVLVGTPSALEEEARRRKLGKSEGHHITDEYLSKEFSAAARINGTSRAGATGHAEAASFSKFSAAKDPFPSSASGKLGGSPRSTSPPQAGEGKKSVGTHNLKIRAVVPFEEDSDNKGVLYYLGSKGNTHVFSNPALFSPDDPNLVVLRASSRIEGDLASLAGFRHQDGAFFETDSALSSWVSVELPGLLAPTHYTLGYFINGRDHVPRNWVLQASRDNVTWSTLKVHENDASLDGEMHVATWRIPEQANSTGPFRFFRIMQTGPTSSGTMFLVLSFVEFYGTLFQPAELEQ